MVFNQQTEFDFNRALMKGFLGEVASMVARRPNELVSFEAIKNSLKIFGQHYRGVQPVPVAQIVGSTTHRYHDFDHAFLPIQARTKSRWKRVDEAFYSDIELPPVQLYQIGQVYFVRDGHHRVSVARERGQEYIDAEVIELKTRVPLTLADITEHTFEIAGMCAEFMEKTQLDELRPESAIHFSEPGGYVRLIEHIAVHRYYMGMEQKKPIRWQDAVLSWHDHLYAPIVQAIREHNILRDFPHRTEADLYLWIMDHYYFLREQDENIAIEEAAVDFAAHYSQRLDKRLVRSVRQAVASFIGDSDERLPLIGTMASEPHPHKEGAE
jgi:hypothetical protein